MILNDGKDFEIKIKFTQVDESDELKIQITTNDGCNLTQGQVENSVLLAIHQIRTDRYEARKVKEKENKSTWFKRILKRVNLN